MYSDYEEIQEAIYIFMVKSEFNKFWSSYLVNSLPYDGRDIHQALANLVGKGILRYVNNNFMWYALT